MRSYWDLLDFTSVPRLMVNDAGSAQIVELDDMELHS